MGVAELRELHRKFAFRVLFGCGFERYVPSLCARKVCVCSFAACKNTCFSFVFALVFLWTSGAGMRATDVNRRIAELSSLPV